MLPCTHTCTCMHTYTHIYMYSCKGKYRVLGEGFLSGGIACVYSTWYNVWCFMNIYSTEICKGKSKLTETLFWNEHEIFLRVSHGLKDSVLLHTRIHIHLSLGLCRGESWVGCCCPGSRSWSDSGHRTPSGYVQVWIYTVRTSSTKFRGSLLAS